MPVKFSTSIRKVFRWKVSNWIIAAILAGWLTMIQMQKNFDACYFAIAIGTILAVGTWLNSETLRRAKPTKKQLAGANSQILLRNYHLTLWCVFTILLIPGIFASYITFVQQRSYELSKLNDVLFPANDPDPPSSCDHVNPPIPPTALRMYFGGLTVAGYGKHVWILHLDKPAEGEDPILLGIERAADGTAALHLNATGVDGKMVAHIDHNHFQIRRNALADPFSPPRTDRSTIQITDEYGNKLRVRFMNPHSILFSGKLVIHDNSFVQIDEEGIRWVPYGLSMASPGCWTLTNPEGAGMLGLK
jgi:hypothetical protein